MANHDKPSFSFGTRELRRAERDLSALALVDSMRSSKRDGGAGGDPYNTSGSFDRRKNWARVGKR